MDSSNDQERPQNRRVSGGRPRLHPILMCYTWGPLLLDEFYRVTATEKAALASAGQGTDLMPATMSFSGMQRIFRLSLEAELTLPTKTNIKKGEVQPFSYNPSLNTFYRVYEAFFHADPERFGRYFSALTGGDWGTALEIAFSLNGYGNDAAWRTTGHYLRFENTLAGIASGIGFLFLSEPSHPLLSLTEEQQRSIIEGNFAPIRGIANHSKVGLGWILAAYTALYRRGDAGKLACEQLRNSGNNDSGMNGLHDLLWGAIPDYRESELFGLYQKMSKGQPIERSKPGPKPKKREKPVATPEVAEDSVGMKKPAPDEKGGAPAATPAISPPVPPTKKPSVGANLLLGLDGSSLTQLATDAALKSSPTKP